MKKVLVILGPTATGKTDLALKLAKKFNGELVACDSRQVYKGLDIGTGKDKDKVSAWMYDVADPKTQYSVYQYVIEATKVVNNVLKRKKLPIIVGGTGLYLKALTEGLPNLSIPIDPVLRGELEKLPVGELQKKLQSLSPTVWTKLNPSDRKNPRRLLRSVELHTNPHIMTSRNLKVKIKDYNLLKIGLTAPRSVLYKRIDSRLDFRIRQGLVQEGKRLLRKGVSLKRMKQLGLEYGVLAGLLAGNITKEQFTIKLKLKIHQFAKRQLTWFKKYEADAKWFDITKKNYYQSVERYVLDNLVDKTR